MCRNYFSDRRCLREIVTHDRDRVPAPRWLLRQNLAVKTEMQIHWPIQLLLSFLAYSDEEPRWLVSQTMEGLNARESFQI